MNETSKELFDTNTFNKKDQLEKNSITNTSSIDVYNEKQ